MKKLNHLLFVLMFVILSTFSVTAQESSKVTRQAGELLAQGNTKGAIGVLDKAIEKQKDLFEAYKMRSSLRFFNNDTAGGISDLDHAIEIKPEAALFAQRAEYKTFLRDSAGALKDYDYAIANGYRLEKVYVGRATLKRNTGDFNGAVTDYQTAVGLNPNAAQSIVGLASVLDQTGRTAEAIEILQSFLDKYEEKRDGSLPKSKMEPNGQSVLLKDEKSDKEDTQIFLQGQQMKTDITADTQEEAEKQMRIQERILNVSLAYANLAQMLERTGEIDRALTAVNKSIAIYKNDFYSIGLRGKILLDKGDLENALTDLNNAIGKSPNISSPYADRGIVFLLLGKDAEAQKDFDKFLSLAPKAADYLNKRIEAAKQKRSGQ